MKLLMLGPRYHNAGMLGGVVVSFESLLEELLTQGVTISVIDTNKVNYPNRIFAVVSILFQFLLLGAKADHVSLHGDTNNFKYIAPFVVFMCNLMGKMVSLRKFAGDFIQDYESAGPVAKHVLNYVLQRADALFFETRYLVEYFAKHNPNTYWLPNYRPACTTHPSTRSFQRKFVFMGHVRKEKGICEILSAMDILSHQFCFDIYGNMVDDFKDSIGRSNATYKGVIKPQDVTKVLIEYDVLVLPSYWKGEGYPGAIIEAFSVGLPVISTTLKGIREIVTIEKNGVLIEPRNVTQLVEAMQFFNDENHAAYSEHALESFDMFEISNVTKGFLEIIDT